jgi:hypothetical protein
MLGGKLFLSVSAPILFVFGGGVLSKELRYFHNGMPCVIEWIAFEGRSVLSNPADDVFEGFATSECALCKSPVVFGLAQVGPRRAGSFYALVIIVARRILSVDV